MSKPILFLLFASIPAHAGTSYEYTITHTGSNDWNIRSVVEVDGSRQRVKFLDVDGYMAATAQSEYRKDAFAVSTDAGASATFIYPVEKQRLEKQFGITSETHGFSIEIKDPEVSVRDLGDGGVIDGLPTRRSEIRLSYVREVDVGGNTTTSKVAYESDAWTTDAIAEGDAAFIMHRFFRDQLPEEIQSLIDERLPDSGRFAVRRVTTVHVPVNGKPVTSVTTESMTNHHPAEVSNSDFALPESYAVVTHAPVPGKN